MRIFVRAKPGAKRESIQKLQEPDGLFPKAGAGATMPQFVVAVKERPTDGKANRAIEKAIAGYFKVPLARVRIVSGHASREKVIWVKI
ncbi:MAG: DUF167 domain-containing protein [Minisyncoccia bacterium]|jgi:uncharacterized protein YggU (UPF0235/DUF167 family)